MECIDKARERWNSLADNHNQWEVLGQDEQRFLVLRQLVYEFVECYFERNYRGIKPLAEDACVILDEYR